ncbi:hypothetical protein [Burkholderia contaminans]|uniref:hypothetical protein n=1 Tax=Burkholderia contaminans TaxID=488447 RepID=UPI003D67A810
MTVMLRVRIRLFEVTVRSLIDVVLSRGGIARQIRHGTGAAPCSKSCFAFADSNAILRPGNAALVPAEPGAGQLHEQIQPIEVGKFGRLVVRLRWSELDGIK